MVPLHLRTHTTLHVYGFKFRDWFGVSWFHCTWEHILHATFWAFNFRDWIGVSCLYCTFQSTLEATFTVLNLGIGLGFMVLLHPSKHARDYVYSFYSSTLVTKPISEPCKRRSLAVMILYNTLHVGYSSVLFGATTCFYRRCHVHCVASIQSTHISEDLT